MSDENSSLASPIPNLQDDMLVNCLTSEYTSSPSESTPDKSSFSSPTNAVNVTTFSNTTFEESFLKENLAPIMTKSPQASSSTENVAFRFEVPVPYSSINHGTPDSKDSCLQNLPVFTKSKILNGEIITSKERKDYVSGVYVIKLNENNGKRLSERELHDITAEQVALFPNSLIDRDLQGNW